VVAKFINRAMHHILFIAQSHPNLSDRWGYHLRPIHYYEPIPDFSAITSEQLERRREFRSIDFRWDDQLRLLHELTAYRHELDQIDSAVEAFLSFNSEFQVALANHWLTLDHESSVRELWREKSSSSSFWFYRR
jgi:hypothetical protein